LKREPEWRIALSLAIVGTLCVAIAAIPAGQMQEIIRHVFGRTIRGDRFEIYRSGLIIVGAFLFYCAALLRFFPVRDTLGWLRLPVVREMLVKSVLWDSPPSPWVHKVVVGGIIFSGVLLRAFLLNEPMQTDEAATYLVFASRPLMLAVADYSMPNNHLLNTLAMAISTRLFGNSEWAIRLPVFCVGILTMFAIYMAGRALYGYRAGAIAVAIAAASPRLVEYSISARGYIFVALATVLCIVFVRAALRRGAAGPEPLFVALSCAFGLCAMPTMLLPMIGIYVWWFLCELIARGKVALGHWISAQVTPVLLMGLIVFAFYLPACVYSGPQRILHNRFVAPLSLSRLLPASRIVAENTWISWNDELPTSIVYLIAVGALLSVILYFRSRTLYLAPAPVLLIAGVTYSFAARTVGSERVWLYLLPVYIITAAGGLEAALQRIRVRDGFVAAMCIVLLGVSSTAVAKARSDCWVNPYGVLADQRPIADTLGQNVRQDDGIAFADDGYHAIWYRALNRYPVLEQVLTRPSTQPRRIFLVVGQPCATELIQVPERICFSAPDPDLQLLRESVDRSDTHVVDRVIDAAILRTKQRIAAGKDGDPLVLAFEKIGGSTQLVAAFRNAAIFIRQHDDHSTTLAGLLQRNGR